MLFYALNVFSIVLLGLSSAEEITLPVTTCKRDSADYSACLKHAINEAWPRFVKGLPEFDIPNLDPLLYEKGTVAFNVENIHAVITLSNVNIYGLSKSYFNDARSHFLDDSFRLEIDYLIPNILTIGTVDMNGTLGIFRIAGKGPFNVSVSDVEGTWDFTGPVVNDTWIIKHSRTLPSVKKIKLYFDLFADNKEINDLAVGFANEFWPPLYRVMLPIVAKEWDQFFSNLGNNFFSKVPFSKVFP